MSDTRKYLTILEGTKEEVESNIIILLESGEYKLICANAVMKNNQVHHVVYLIHTFDF